MIIRSTYQKHDLAVAVCAIFILLIGFKVILPILKMNRNIVEYSLAAIENDLDKGEKKGDDVFKNKKEYISNYYHYAADTFLVDVLIHTSPYIMQYCSNHYQQITTPPPEYGLHKPSKTQLKS